MSAAKMSTHPPRPLAEMRAVAERLVAELAPFCERIEIAGSIRRQKAQCADIEIVCAPRYGTARKLCELLPRHDVDLVDQHTREQLDRGRWLPRLDKNGRPALGERYKRLLVGGPEGGIPLDLFTVAPPASFAVIFLIRTGSAEFAKAMVTQQSKGGRLRNGCRVEGGAIWSGGLRLEIADEQAWFDLCGMRFMPPECRLEGAMALACLDDEQGRR